MLKIAILGHSSEPHTSLAWQQARHMAGYLSEYRHQIIAAGANGIASAAATGVRDTHGVSGPGQFSYLRVLTDIGGADNFFPSESNDDDYYTNLGRLITHPDIWVFFPGSQGTNIQLQSVIHAVKRGEISLQYKWVVIIGENNPLRDYATRFLALENQRMTMPVLRNDLSGRDLGIQIGGLATDISDRALRLVTRVWRDFQQDGTMSHWQLREKLGEIDPHMGYDLRDRMIVKAAASGLIKIISDVQPVQMGNLL